MKPVQTLLEQPWAIVPASLTQIHAIYARHARGEAADLAAIEAKLGRPLANERKPVQVVDGVAVLGLEGVLCKHANLLTEISGGTSTSLAVTDLQAALDSPAVHAVVLAIDSPGGTVDGTERLVDAVRAGRKRKPIVTLADGAMASAAYWIGAAAGPGNVFLASGTTQAGSIGIVAKHVDVSRAEAQQGVRTTEIVAGRYKRIASQYAPLTAEGQQSMQDAVDYVYSLFLDSVARDRGVSATRVHERMADGRVFTGQQAIDAGLADGIATLEQVIARLSRAHAAGATLVSLSTPSTSPTESAMDRLQASAALPYNDEQLRAHYQARGLAAQYGSFENYRAALVAIANERPPAPAATQPSEQQRLADQAAALVKAEGIDIVAALKRVGVR